MTPIEQYNNKILWNHQHGNATPDFFTVGYTGLGIQKFIDNLRYAKVRTLIDVRYLPLSRFKPEFSKSNLQRSLSSNGITYLHRRDLGVPSEIRKRWLNTNHNAIWSWYDETVIPTITKINLSNDFRFDRGRFALMCMEYDPTECHRHRIFLELTRLGLQGRDL
jgi:uncharacterized protein (DUF488 family)